MPNLKSVLHLGHQRSGSRSNSHNGRRDGTATRGRNGEATPEPAASTSASTASLTSDAPSSRASTEVNRPQTVEQGSLRNQGKRDLAAQGLGRVTSLRKKVGSDKVRRKPSERRKEKRALLRREKKAAKEGRLAREQAQVEQRRNERAKDYDTDPSKALYGVLADDADMGRLEPLDTIKEARIGDTVRCRARIHAVRPLSSRLTFFLLRYQLATVQAVLRAGDGQGTSDPSPSRLMVKWGSKLSRETIVIFEGQVRKPNTKEGRVKSAEVHDAEVVITKLWVVSEVLDPLPFGVAEASRLPREGLTKDQAGAAIGMHTRFEHRPISLRVPFQHAILRTMNAATRAARAHLDSLGFIEIHSAKLQQGATESGASVFQVDYFGRAAYLAQSPQLAKEISIGADLDRVYEIGPVFRAENSQTHRHLTEFTGLDLEMTLSGHYHEAMRVIDNLLKNIFRALQKECRTEIELVKRFFPHEEFVFPEETVVLTFAEGVKMLREAGYRDEGEDENAYEMEDLSTRGEVRLGQLVKEKYNTDYYILDKFPLAVRPFYTMPDPQNPKLANAFDIFVRGEEILSGGQRVHKARHLEARLKSAGIDFNSMSEYLEAFRGGMPPHAGGGIGVERLIMLFLKLGNIRHATLFPRDPRSFQENPLVGSRMAKIGARLKVPEVIEGFDEPDSLSYDPLKRPEHPELVDLISKHGDSTATALTDPAYEIWRHRPTGAAIGFVPGHGHAVTWGAPLCPKEDLSEVIRAYIEWLQYDRQLQPVWLNADEPTERILARQLGWPALAVTSEQRVNVSVGAFTEDKNTRRKLGKAEREGVVITVLEGKVPKAVKDEVDERIRAWRSARKGEQVHTTEVRPWADATHRVYMLARDGKGKACGLVVLHQLAPVKGYQLKWALAFPGCPPGTSEYIVHKAIDIMRKGGVQTATFGAGARTTMEAVDNMKGMRAKVLTEVYNGLVSRFNLTRKTKYREKFGAEEETLYTCFPHGSLGLSGIRAIMASVREPPPAKERAERKAEKSEKKQEKTKRLGRSSSTESRTSETVPARPERPHNLRRVSSI